MSGQGPRPFGTFQIPGQATGSVSGGQDMQSSGIAYPAAAEREPLADVSPISDALVPPMDTASTEAPSGGLNTEVREEVAQAYADAASVVAVQATAETESTEVVADTGEFATPADILVIGACADLVAEMRDDATYRMAA